MTELAKLLESATEDYKSGKQREEEIKESNRSRLAYIKRLKKLKKAEDKIYLGIEIIGPDLRWE